MKTWNNHLFPPGGFRFVDVDNIEHRAINIEALITQLAEYRVRRGLAPGNPVAEVNEYLCIRYPSRCHQQEGPGEEILARTRANDLTTSVAVWLRETWRKVSQRKITWAPDHIVKVRVETCLACPFHQRAIGDCPTCNESLNQVSFQLRAGRDRRSHTLAACKRYQTDVRVDVLLDQPTDPQAPPNCWKYPPVL